MSDEWPIEAEWTAVRAACNNGGCFGLAKTCRYPICEQAICHKFPVAMRAAIRALAPYRAAELTTLRAQVAQLEREKAALREAISAAFSMPIPKGKYEITPEVILMPLRAAVNLLAALDEPR